MEEDGNGMPQETDLQTVRAGQAQIVLAACVTLFSFASDASADVRPTSCSADAAYDGPALRRSLPTDVFPNGDFDPSKAMAREAAAALDEQFTATVGKVGAPAVAVGVWQPDLGYWSRTSGIAEGASRSFWVASVGKMVTGAIVLQLIEEGKLSLDATIDRWFPEYPGAALISIDALLTHTGGVFSFNADKNLGKRKGYKSSDTLLKTAARHELDFCPGTNWFYTNTGYLMLGLIAEAIEEKPLDEIVQERIASPLKLTSLSVIGKDDPVASLVPTAGTPPTSIPDIASIQGAGALRADTIDLLTFLHAYLTGKLVSDSSRRHAFATLYPMFGDPMHYGRGVMVMDVPDADAPTTWLGHVGGSPNAKSVLMYDVRRKAFIAVSLNAQGPAEALANVLMKTLDNYLTP